MNTQSSVPIEKLADKMNLTYQTPEVNLKGKALTTTQVNRPALQLTGYFDYFDADRLQVIGYVEYTYLETLTRERKRVVYEQLLASKIPAIVYTTQTIPEPDMLELAVKYDVPIFTTDRETSAFVAEVLRWLNVELAPCITIHGVLVDVYGEGVLIMGESGIGKSEAALELIKRGHRLITDDVVEIRKVSDTTLVGTAPDITRHFIELRGIGIINVKTLFGVEAVMDTTNIDLVIKLEARAGGGIHRVPRQQGHVPFPSDPSRQEPGGDRGIRGSQPQTEEDGIQCRAGAVQQGAAGDQGKHGEK